MLPRRRHIWYDTDGQPISLIEWALKLEDDAVRQVALTWVRGWAISTVWLGIDAGTFSPVPLIFETMIFAPGDVRVPCEDDLDHYQERYPTAGAARAGHDRAVAAVLEHLGPDAAADVTTGQLTAAGDDGDWDTAAARLHAQDHRDPS